jgi:Holliday junction resolvase-like predicted endonuclease
MTGPESAFEKKVCKKLKDKGVISVKLSGPNQVGQPDRLFLRDGYLCFVEFKSYLGRVTPMQQRQLDKLTTRRFRVLVARPKDGVDNVVAIIDAMLTKACP